MHSPSRVFLSRRGLVSASFTAGLLLAVQQAAATTFNWDPGLTPATASGGDGTWNTTNTNWSNGSTDVAWPNVLTNDDKAVFAGTAGTVTVSSGLNVGGIQFDTSGYTISGAATDLTLSPQVTGSDAFVVSSGVDNITISLRRLILTASGSGAIGDLVNLDKVNFGSTIVAFSGSRQMTLSNSSTSATTTFTNFAIGSGSPGGASLYLNQGNLTITNFAASTNGSNALATATTTGTTVGLAIRGTGAGTLTLTGNNTLLNTTGVGGTIGINLLNANATYDIQHDNALGARNASSALTSTYVEFGGGTLLSSNGVRTLENAITHTGTFTIGGSNAITLAGTYTHSGGNRTLNNNDSGGLTLSGSVLLANDNVTARTLTLAGTGNTVISGNISNNSAGNTVASSLTKNGAGTLTLSGTNTYTGLTTVSAGKLLINGTNTGGSYSIASGATFGGTGTIDLSVTNGSVTIGNGSFLEATSADTLTFTLGAGALNVSGALANASPSMLFTLGAPGSAVVSATSANIGTGLLTFADFNFTAGTGFGAGIYTLFQLTSVTGSFGANLTGTVGGLDATISQSGNDIILTATASSVPEPSTFATLAGVGAIGAALLRRRQRG
jgi:autotransporter-associated beta strand protein